MIFLNIYQKIINIDLVLVAGFSAETENLIKNSIKKMKDKNCDLIFANDVSKKGIGFNSDYNKVSVIDKRVTFK